MQECVSCELVNNRCMCGSLVAMRNERKMSEDPTDLLAQLDPLSLAPGGTAASAAGLSRQGTSSLLPGMAGMPGVSGVPGAAFTSLPATATSYANIASTGLTGMSRAEPPAGDPQLPTYESIARSSHPPPNAPMAPPPPAHPPPPLPRAFAPPFTTPAPLGFVPGQPSTGIGIASGLATSGGVPASGGAGVGIGSGIAGIGQISSSGAPSACTSPLGPPAPGAPSGFSSMSSRRWQKFDDDADAGGAGGAMRGAAEAAGASRANKGAPTGPIGPTGPAGQGPMGALGAIGDASGPPQVGAPRTGASSLQSNPLYQSHAEMKPATVGTEDKPLISF